MKLFIFPNLRTQTHVSLADCAIRRFEALGNTCSMSEERCRKMYGDTRYVRFSVCEADLIVAIGGDGSVLRAAQPALEHDKPLLGVNSGRLGFLCALDADDAEHWSPDLWSTLTPSRRILLSFRLGETQYYSLNDVVMAKERFGESMEMEVSFCKESHRFCGDGVVIATPTGSTAYNLSAGGPLLHTEVPAFAVTPICPHDGRIRSKVVPQDCQIRLTLHRCADSKAQVYSDGIFCGMISDSLVVHSAEKTLTLYTKE